MLLTTFSGNISFIGIENRFKIRVRCVAKNNFSKKLIYRSSDRLWKSVILPSQCDENIELVDYQLEVDKGKLTAVENLKS